MDAYRGKSRPSELRSETSAEDFLFHLYRGSELLQDDRVHQAKEELEAALRLQPRDPKGQDLLAVVYFRLGLYPRAIEIYEELVGAFPMDASLRNNLALCYLKTGQSDKARAILEQLVMHQPEHIRAWGYLGLAYERLGDYGKAKEAFERGKAEGMARRMEERLGTSSRDEAKLDPADELEMPPGEGFEELEGGGLSVSPSPSVPPPPPVSLPHPPELSKPSFLPLEPPPRAGASLAMTLAGFAQRSALEFPEGAPLVALSDETVAARFATSFALRLEALRAVMVDTESLASEVLPRRSEGQASEVALGGPVAPIVTLSASGELVLGARSGHRLTPLLLNDESIALREGSLLGFDLSNLAYESFALHEAEAGRSHMVRLRGKGGIVLETARELTTLRIDGSRHVTIRRDALIGWIGELVWRPLPRHEAPGKALGLLSFSGEGALLLAAHAGGLLP